MNVRRGFRRSPALLISLLAHALLAGLFAFTFIWERVNLSDESALAASFQESEKRKPAARRLRPQPRSAQIEAAAPRGGPPQILFASEQSDAGDGGFLDVGWEDGAVGASAAEETFSVAAPLKAPPAGRPMEAPRLSAIEAIPPPVPPAEAPAAASADPVAPQRLEPPVRELGSAPRSSAPALAGGARSRRSVTKPGKQSIAGADIRRMPGAGGDPLRALRSMPGVAVANDLSGELYIRGGSSDENRFYFDRIQLGYPYHFGGIVSTLSSEIIDRIDVHAGGFGAEYGEAQAVIEIVPKRQSADGASLTSNLNPLLSELFASTPLGGNGAAYLAGRRSYVDLILPRLLETDLITAFPRFWDYQAGAELDLSPNQFLRATAFGSQDFMQLLLQGEDVTDNPEFAGDLRYKYRFFGQGATLESNFEGGAALDSTAAYNVFQFDFTIGQGFFLKIDQRMWTLREDLIVPLGKRHLVEAGAEAYVGESDISSFFLRPPDEGSEPREFDEEEAFRASSKEPMAWLSAYVKDTIALSDGLKATLGARAQRYNITENLDIDPRLSLSYAPDDVSSLRLAWGLYSQSPQPYEAIPPWGNSDLESLSASHLIAEAERRIGDGLSVKIAAYQKSMRDLPISDPVSVYLSQGTGAARGVELFAKYNPSDRFFGWLSYAYGRSTRQDRPDEEERLFSFDQTHIATVSAVLAPSPKWEIGFKWHYATGLPYTPVVDAQIVRVGLSKFRIEPVYGETNSERFPYYSRVDVRASRNWELAGAEIGAYLEVWNAMYRKNVLDINYSSDYSEEEPIYQLPLVPFVGLSMRF